MLTIDLNTLLFLVRTTPNWCRTTGPKQDPNWLPNKPERSLEKVETALRPGSTRIEYVLTSDYKSNFADYSTFSMSQLRWSIHKTYKPEKGVFQYDVLCIIVFSNKFHNRWSVMVVWEAEFRNENVGPLSSLPFQSISLSFLLPLSQTRQYWPVYTTQRASMTSAKKFLEDLAKMIFKTHEYLCHDW